MSGGLTSGDQMSRGEMYGGKMSGGQMSCTDIFCYWVSPILALEPLPQKEFPSKMCKQKTLVNVREKYCNSSKLF